MKITSLPKNLRPIDSSLKRLGDINDGGYLVSYESVVNSDCLISFGLEENWTFETDFSKQNNIDIYCFDASVNKKHFRNKLIKNFFRIDNPKYLYHSLKNYINYTNFFNNPKHKHITKYVTYDRDPDNISFLKIRDEILVKYHQIFFKIDIEGSEYRLLNDLIEIQNKISSLVIEFHDVDINLQRIINFSNNFKLPIININANNNGLVSTNNLPTVIEVTYAFPDIINKFQDKNSFNNIKLVGLSINFDNNL